MKQLPIRWKLTLWFTAALVLVSLFTLFIVVRLSDRILQKTIRDNLIETVENNVDEVEFYTDPAGRNDIDYYLLYGDGYLEIDDDFLNQVNQVYTALYDADGAFLYGENPIPRDTVDLPFSSMQIQTCTAGGTTYYVFDHALTAKGLDGLWLRGIVSASSGQTQTADLLYLSLIVLPVLIVLAALGGYLMARRSLRPMQKIASTANHIEAGGDLQKRIDIGQGDDEVHRLADSFNRMFDRLSASFETERRFTADASHELRTPVSVILAQCELSLQTTQTEEEYRDALRLIARQSTKMSHLVNDLLTFARMEQPGEMFTRSTFDFSDLVQSVCQDMALIKEQDITLTWQIQPHVTYVGNVDLLTRMLQNLIGNAYRYGKPGGHIEVTLTQANAEITLSVSDDGIGIDPAQQDQIFQRFYQADASHSGKGAGLGLSLVAQIVKYHGGTIHVESEVGHGSTFFVTFQGTGENAGTTATV